MARRPCLHCFLEQSVIPVAKVANLRHLRQAAPSFDVEAESAARAEYAREKRMCLAEANENRAPRLLKLIGQICCAVGTATLRDEGTRLASGVKPRSPPPLQLPVSQQTHHQTPMAEPLGLIGVVGVAVQLIQLSTKLGLDWKDAPAEVKSFILELQSLKTVLSETNTNVLLNQDFADAFHGRHSALLSELDPLHDTSTQALVSSCETELQTLLTDLRKQAQGQRLGWERLKAAFQASRTRDAVQDLRRRCAALNELLQIDTAAVVASTHREVKEGRREQQQQHYAQSRAWDHIRERVDEQGDRHAEERVRQEEERVRQDDERVRQEEERARQAEERARQEKDTVLNWLTPVDYALEHNDLLRRRQPGTGKWLLESEEFKTWCVKTGASSVRSFGAHALQDDERPTTAVLPRHSRRRQDDPLRHGDRPSTHAFLPRPGRGHCISVLQLPAPKHARGR